MHCSEHWNRWRLHVPYKMIGSDSFWKTMPQLCPPWTWDVGQVTQFTEGVTAPELLLVVTVFLHGSDNSQCVGSNQRWAVAWETKQVGTRDIPTEAPRVLPPVVSWARCVWPGVRSKDSVQRSKLLFCFHMLCVMKRELISLRHSWPAAFIVQHFMQCIFCTIKLEINWISS